MHIYNDITETNGRTPLVRLRRVTAGVGAEVPAKLECLEVASRSENRGKMIVVIFPDTGERYLTNGPFEA